MDQLHGVYLRAFIVAKSIGSIDYRSETSGMSNRLLSAVALALHDAHHGRDPKTIDALLSAVNGMTSEAVAVCV